jgi:GNAT superfamily N-acetyltransferase
VPDEWLAELEQTEEDRDRWEDEAGKLELELLQANEEIERLRASFRQVADGASPAAPQEPADVDQDEPKTVLGAVERAEGLCPHLVFVDAAFESAEDSPFEDPSAILEALLKLETLAAQEARQGGIGKALADAALELGLQWRGGISQTAATRYEADYVARWDGETILLGPHVCLGSGSGAGKIARIYLYRHEAEKPEDRRYVIGHVGRKLRDTTT